MKYPVWFKPGTTRSALAVGRSDLMAIKHGPVDRELVVTIFTVRSAELREAV
jgi:hypothetical protein